ncbi:MAG: acylphosphatase, partial [Candidatus Diapherotrites archaeon]|nr:acylphosphatase [Candidatus Diapherotrites archaeon]
MLKTFELIVEGQVQRVGFRNFVSQIALELNIKGTVENLAEEKVQITAQGEQDKILEFIKRIWTTEWPIDVWNIE